jgi:dolichol-phosphate mannosyltransferase
VGGSGVFVDMVVLFILIDPGCFGVSLVIGKICSAQTAMVNNFIWNDIWTFRDYSLHDLTWQGRLKRFLKFNVVCSLGLILSIILLHVQVVRFGYNPYIANIVAIVSATFWNYGFNRCFNWGNKSLVSNASP